MAAFVNSSTDLITGMIQVLANHLIWGMNFPFAEIANNSEGALPLGNGLGHAWVLDSFLLCRHLSGHLPSA